uniref:DUF8040 domain-containing protein n=1 Tax=Lactuca sativa TaxID=4236 RepID=A0A9R1V9F1_LACSA|nr:hypothetical protein LSAT_V11C600332590 [Lactuca sativa]
MTRTPLHQRIVQNRKIVRTSAVRAFYAMYVMIRWWMYDFTMNRLEKATILREKYLMSYHNGRDMIKKSVVNIRMNRNAFTRLCDILEQRGGLKNSKNMLVDEQVDIFFHDYSRKIQKVRRNCKSIFQGSLRCEFYKKPMPIPNDETDERWRWFKSPQQRENLIEHANVSFVLMHLECVREIFSSYVLAGWEGSATDSRVLRDEHTTFVMPVIQIVKVFNTLSWQRYHLNDWSRPPTNAKELWAILRDNAYHPIESMPRIIITCCLMPNFIRTTIPEDPLDQKIPTNHTQFGDKHDNILSTVETSQGGTDRRDLLANTMFTDWNSRRANN